MGLIVVELLNHPMDGILLLLGYTLKVVTVPFLCGSLQLQLARLINGHKSVALSLLI